MSPVVPIGIGLGLFLLAMSRKTFAKGKSPKSIPPSAKVPPKSIPPSAKVPPKVKVPVDPGEPRIHSAPMKLSKNFDLSEFLVTGDKALAKKVKAAKLNDTELSNVKRQVVNILQPLRDTIKKPIIITSGVRPLSVMSAQQWVDYLNSKGYKASITSDHFEGGSADFVIPKATDAQFIAAAKWLARNPNVRQVIAYFKTRNGRVVPQHLHAAVVRPGKGRFRKPTKFAFAMKDGQLLPGGTRGIFAIDEKTGAPL